MKKKLAIISLLTLSMTFALTGCGTTSKEVPAAGVSIANAEGQTLGFTYLYDLGNGYKLYADNFTKIVYLRYDYKGGKGATSVGSSSFCPYISPSGNYYKINTQTRVIEEYIPNHSISSSTDDLDTEVDVTEGESSSSQKEDIEAILNENGQKNQNSNNQQINDTTSSSQSDENDNTKTSNQDSQNPNDNTNEVAQQNPNEAVGTIVEENTEENIEENTKQK